MVHLSELKDFINQTQRNSEGSQDSNAGHFADGFTGWLVLHPLDSNDNGKGRRNSSANARESEMNAFTDILSSDNPREGIQLPQLKLRIQMELH